MSFKTIVNNSRTWWAHASAHGAYRIRLAFHARPLASASVLVAAGLLIGVAGRSAAGMAQVSLLQAKAEQRDAELDQVRRGAQQEINAMAARLGELQAQANRLNALGERLTRVGQLQDGEFDFNEPVGVGGNDVSYDMKPAELVAGVDKLEQQFAASGRQLSVLEALLFNRELDRNATPGRLPIANSYITSGFGGRADPFGGGGQYHKGIDFKASVGDPVLAVADGVVSFAGGIDSGSADGVRQNIGFFLAGGIAGTDTALRHIVKNGSCLNAGRVDGDTGGIELRHGGGA